MRSSFDRDVWAILGMPIDNVTLGEAASLIERAVETRERLSFVTPNVNWLVRALKDPDAMRQIVNADLSLADGAPVVWLARKLGMPLKERVAGSDLFEHLRQDTREDAVPIRVFFFGGREGAAQKASEALAAHGGRMVAVGWHNPGFGDVESMSTEEILAKINAAGPDFIIVSLGAAKGQAWIEHNLDQLEAPVIAHLGAVVDFVAGTIRRAPHWMSRIGLEWLWRIFAEPSLWKRYWRDGWALLGFVNGRLKPLRKAAKVVGGPEPVSAEPSDGALALKGDLVLAQRGPLRSVLAAAAQDIDDLTLDLTEVNALDASGLGQIRMLERSLTRQGKMLAIRSSDSLKPALQATGMI